MTERETAPSRRRPGQAGQSLVESAMVIPLVLLMFMGTVDVGRLLFAYIALEEAVQEGATYGSHEPASASAIRNRVRTSSDHQEVQLATVPDPVCVPQDTSTTPPTPGTLTVSASYDMPLITPVGSLMFGGTFRLGATVVATNLDGSCS